MVEVWKEIPGLENYAVSNLGNVKNLGSGKILKYRKHTNGYARVCLCDDGKHFDKYVHRLVAESFMNIDFNRKQVNHIDGNKFNNCVDNLEWCTQQENISHAIRTKLFNNTGSNNGQAKLKESDVTIIKKLIREGKHKKAEIARMYRVSDATIRNIETGKKWGSVLI